MPRYGKMLRERLQAAGIPLEMRGKRLRFLGAYLVLLFSLGFFYSERWIASVASFVVYVVLVNRAYNAPPKDD